MGGKKDETIKALEKSLISQATELGIKCIPHGDYSKEKADFGGIHISGQLWMVRAFLPRMVELDKGSVVSLCSIAGHAGAPHMVPYSASKFAVKGMMEALHQELRQESPDHQIHFMTVSPFIVDTGMIKGASIRFPSKILILFQV